MLGWIKKHSYWALAVAVLVVAVVAIGAYAWTFKERPISTDTGKWADFATYLSGTVGVAAVVATLIAFVITLRHQQKLIDSQDEMLKKQQTQIELAHKQLDEEVRRKEVEFSHSRAINVFPKLAAYCKKSVHKTFYPNSRFIIICYERNNSLEGVHSNTVFCYPDKIISDWHEGLDKKEVARDIEALMVDVSSISEMMIDCLKVSPDLFPYFDAFLVDGGVDGGNVNYWDYIKMYYSYLLGLGDEEKYLNMSSCFRFSDGVVNEQWNQVGNLLS